jgi:hypothetical protein
MTDAPAGGSGSNGEAATTGDGSSATAASEAGAGVPNAKAPGAPSRVRKAISLVKQYPFRTLIKEHPLGAVAAVAAAAVLIEVELAVGMFAGLGATALLATESGPEVRQRALKRGKWALERAKSAMHRYKPTAAPEGAPPPPS